MQSLAARRFGVVAVSAASLIVCCALAWWQWERYSSAGGSFQNLGYVLQWPLFGLFPAFVFLRMRKLRQTARPTSADVEPAEARPTNGTPAAAPTAAASGATDTETPAAETSGLRGRWLYRAPRRPVVADTAGEPGDALAEYNRYLAELNQRTDRDQTS
ncbi:MAG: transcriptional regulator [Actinophytocola sp.]|nr:transcriptional regulator [Actinophytocola sp.]